MTALGMVLRRELLLAYRHRGEWLNPLLFFVLVVSLFPLAVSPDGAVLRVLAHGVLWVVALLACMLSLERLFHADLETGVMEQVLLSPRPTSLLILGKVLGHWLCTSLPLVLCAPVLALLLHLPSEAMLPLLVSLLLGTPTLSLLGAIGQALTVGLPQGGLLLPLLVLPWFAPVLIFGAGAVVAASHGLPFYGHYALLLAMLVMALLLAPWAIVAALKLSVGR